MNRPPTTGLSTLNRPPTPIRVLYAFPIGARGVLNEGLSPLSDHPAGRKECSSEPVSTRAGKALESIWLNGVRWAIHRKGRPSLTLAPPPPPTPAPG